MRTGVIRGVVCAAMLLGINVQAFAQGTSLPEIRVDRCGGSQPAPAGYKCQSEKMDVPIYADDAIKGALRWFQGSCPPAGDNLGLRCVVTGFEVLKDNWGTYAYAAEGGTITYYTTIRIYYWFGQG